MNDFDDIGKQMPYFENDEYLERLICTTTEEAIRHAKPKSRHRLILITASAAASVLLVLGIGFTLWYSGTSSSSEPISSVSPIDEFLNSLSDKEIAALPYYEIEEIPEY